MKKMYLLATILVFFVWFDGIHIALAHNSTDSGCPKPPPKQTHKTCVENACKTIDGSGTDSCKSDADCVPVPPPPPPPPPPVPPPSPNPTPSPSPSPSPSTSTTPASYSCNDTQPPTPTLESVTILSGGRMLLTWSAVSPVSHYAIAYGPNSKNYLYGQADVGNVTTFTVGSLAPGQSYCFVVSAVNGCNSSGFSNEQCSGQVLGASIGVGQVLGLSNTGPGLAFPIIFSLNPSRVIIPGQNIDLPVVEAPVINGYWQLSETSASHGIGTANPGELGNVVIFAHAREGLFLALPQVRVSDQVELFSKDQRFIYQIKETKLVDANDVAVIAPTADETLTLYTCDGFLDAKRFVVVAKRI